MVNCFMRVCSLFVGNTYIRWGYLVSPGGLLAGLIGGSRPKSAKICLLQRSCFDDFFARDENTNWLKLFPRNMRKTFFALKMCRTHPSLHNNKDKLQPGPK